MTKIIGIDLGTSNSAAAVVMGGKPTIIPAAEAPLWVEKHSHQLYRLLKMVNF